jgi:membrane protein implicated in regulation of membrane protease activity
MSLSPILIWFLVGLAFILLEVFMPGIILVFFGLGAWLVTLTTWAGLTGSLTSQLLMWALSSLLLLFLLRRWVRSRLSGHSASEQDPDVDLDDFRGKTVVVVQDVGPDGRDGRVEFKGAEWRATSPEVLKAGDRAVIVGMDGITLLVASKQGEAQR